MSQSPSLIVTHLLSLTDTPRELRQRGVSTTYQALWRAAMEGRIPAIRQGRRWFIRAADLDAIATVFAAVEQ